MPIERSEETVDPGLERDRGIEAVVKPRVGKMMQRGRAGRHSPRSSNQVSAAAAGGAVRPAASDGGELPATAAHVPPDPPERT